MNIGALREGLKLVGQGTATLQGQSWDWTMGNLIDCYEYLLSLAPHQVGHKVRLTKTPDINEKDSWGWLGSKHFLVKGALATIAHVEARKDGFHYLLTFDGDSWINSHTKVIHPRPPNDRGQYYFGAGWVERIPVNATAGQ